MKYCIACFGLLLAFLFFTTCKKEKEKYYRFTPGELELIPYDLGDTFCLKGYNDQICKFVVHELSDDFELQDVFFGDDYYEQVIIMKYKSISDNVSRGGIYARKGINFEYSLSIEIQKDEYFYILLNDDNPNCSLLNEESIQIGVNQYSNVNILIDTINETLYKTYLNKTNGFLKFEKLELELIDTTIYEICR